MIFCPLVSSTYNACCWSSCVPCPSPSCACNKYPGVPPHPRSPEYPGWHPQGEEETDAIRSEVNRQTDRHEKTDMKKQTWTGQIYRYSLVLSHTHHLKWKSPPYYILCQLSVLVMSCRVGSIHTGVFPTCSWKCQFWVLILSQLHTDAWSNSICCSSFFPYRLVTD